MRWNALKDDEPRANALADLMLGAAFADGEYDPSEYVAVTASLMKVMGVAELPPGVSAHIKYFTGQKLNLATTIKKLAPETEADRKGILKVVARVVRADDSVHEAERAYLHGLADTLGIAADAVDALLR